MGRQENKLLLRSGRFSPARGSVLAVVYVIMAALPVILAYALNPDGSSNFLMELGKGAGLLGFALLALQVALSARLKPVDGPFGLDAVMQFHKGMAIFAGILLLAHPLLLAAGGFGWSLFSLATSWQVTLGKVALGLLVLTVGFALAFKKLGIEFQTWRYAHKGAILVVVVGFVHGLVIGPDLQQTGMQVYWWLLLVMAAGLFAYRNVYVPLWGRRRYQVVTVDQESHDTWTIAMQPDDGKDMPHLPGQFMFLRLNRPGRPSEEHPFTISSSPTDEALLCATVKESGDFTDTISETRSGDRAHIEGPCGRFSFLPHNPPAFLFIAGGVGITPIHSMLAYLRDIGDRRPAVLIYGNKTERDILFDKEFRFLPEHMKVVHVLSEPDEKWDGHTGYVTTDIIESEAGEVLDHAHVYLCGPPPMMDKVLTSLAELGVEDRKIHYERFAL